MIDREKLGQVLDAIVDAVRAINHSATVDELICNVRELRRLHLYRAESGLVPRLAESSDILDTEWMDKCLTPICTYLQRKGVATESDMLADLGLNVDQCRLTTYYLKNFGIVSKDGRGKSSAWHWMSDSLSAGIVATTWTSIQPKTPYDIKRLNEPHRPCP